MGEQYHFTGGRVVKGRRVINGNYDLTFYNGLVWMAEFDPDPILYGYTYLTFSPMHVRLIAKAGSYNDYNAKMEIAERLAQNYPQASVLRLAATAEGEDRLPIFRARDAQRECEIKRARISETENDGDHDDVPF